MCFNHQVNDNNISCEMNSNTNQSPEPSGSAGLDDIMQQIASQANFVRKSFESSKRKPSASSATMAAAHIMATMNKRRKLDSALDSDVLSDPPKKNRFTHHFHSPIATLARSDTRKEAQLEFSRVERASPSISAAAPARSSPSPAHAITHITYNDVVCGNGGNTTNDLVGNRRYRVWIDLHRQAFAKALFEEDRRKIAHSIVNTIKGSFPSGRFLSQDKQTGEWHDAGYQQAYVITMNDLAKGIPKLAQPSPVKNSVRRTFVSKAA